MTQIPKVKTGSTIGILGGSFDPPHLGHQLLALSALSLEHLDQLWILPCADHPFSKKLSSFEHRKRMCDLAFGVFDHRVRVVGIENNLPHPSYSVQTLEAILKSDPTLKIKLLMGSDVYADLKRWKNPQKLFELCNISVFLRDGAPIGEKPQNADVKVHDRFVLPHIKSTVIRNALNSGNSIDNMVDKGVLDYIKEHKLYT